MDLWPEVIQVVPTSEYKVYIYFDDGVIKLYDAADIVTKGVFKQLTENGLFMDVCTVLNGTLAWSPDKSYDTRTCLDLDPIYLYETCPTVDEPIYIS